MILLNSNLNFHVCNADTILARVTWELGKITFFHLYKHVQHSSNFNLFYSNVVLIYWSNKNSENRKNTNF